MAEAAAIRSIVISARNLTISTGIGEPGIPHLVVMAVARAKFGTLIVHLNIARFVKRGKYQHLKIQLLSNEIDI